MTKSKSSKKQNSKSPKKVSIIILTTIIASITLALSGFFLWRSFLKTTLSSEYYTQAEIKNISIDKLRTLVSEQKSFAVFVSQPDCRTADDLRRILGEFTEQYQLTVYEIAFSELKQSDLAPDVKYYPSFIIFRAGKVKAFLHADSTEDSAAYNSFEGFSDWFQKHAKLPQSSR